MLSFNNCESLSSNFHPSKRQIALYSPCPLIGRLVGVTIDFPFPNVFLHFLLGFSSSPERKTTITMIIPTDQPLANDHPDGPASCKGSSGGTGLLQMIIWMDRPLSKDHLEGPVSCKWSSGWTGLLQKIIWRDRSLANDHLDGAVSCKWSEFKYEICTVYLV